MHKPTKDAATRPSDPTDLTTGRLNVALFDPSVFPHDAALREQMLAWFRDDAASRVIITSRMNQLLAEQRDATLGALLRRVFASLLRAEGLEFPPVAALSSFLSRAGVMSADELLGARNAARPAHVSPLPAPAPSASHRDLSDARAAFHKAGEILANKGKG